MPNYIQIALYIIIFKDLYNNLVPNCQVLSSLAMQQGIKILALCSQIVVNPIAWNQVWAKYLTTKAGVLPALGKMKCVRGEKISVTTSDSWGKVLITVHQQTNKIQTIECQ